MAYEALLELDQDLVFPPDNFTLFKVTEDAYKRSAQTSPGNITRNETTMAELEDSELNPTPEDGIYDSDSAEELLDSLLSEPGARFGQGEWVGRFLQTNRLVIPGTPDPMVVLLHVENCNHSTPPVLTKWLTIDSVELNRLNGFQLH